MSSAFHRVCAVGRKEQKQALHYDMQSTKLVMRDNQGILVECTRRSSSTRATASPRKGPVTG